MLVRKYCNTAAKHVFILQVRLGILVQTSTCEMHAIHWSSAANAKKLGDFGNLKFTTMGSKYPFNQ